MHTEIFGLIFVFKWGFWPCNTCWASHAPIRHPGPLYGKVGYYPWFMSSSCQPGDFCASLHWDFHPADSPPWQYLEHFWVCFIICHSASLRTENTRIAQRDSTLVGTWSMKHAVSIIPPNLAHHSESVAPFFMCPNPAPQHQGQPSTSASHLLIHARGPTEKLELASLVGISTVVFAVLENKFKDTQDTSHTLKLITIKCQR